MTGSDNVKVYIQCGNNSLPYNMNTFSAMLGFQQMGIETTLFTDKEDLIAKLEKNVAIMEHL